MDALGIGVTSDGHCTAAGPDIEPVRGRADFHRRRGSSAPPGPA